MRHGMVICFWMAFIACNSNVRIPVGNEKIGPAGGTIYLDDKSALLEIPVGALDNEIEINLIRPSSNALPEGAIPETLVEITPSGLSFAKPVKMTIVYDKTTLAPSDTTWLKMLELHPENNVTATLFLTHSKKDRSLSAYITRTGKYILADLTHSSAVVKTSQKPIKDVDVLFVIDNSNSMLYEQKNLTNHFPRFIKKLDDANLNYHVGVISTDLGAGSYDIPSCETPGGDQGKLLATPRIAGCTPPTAPYISKINGVTNIPKGDVASAFSCIATLGTSGCGFENTLEAARLALDPKLNINKGFIRKDAALAVIFITDEDDCSPRKTNLYDPDESFFGPLSSFRCFEFGIKCDINDRLKAGPRKNCVPAYQWLNSLSRYETFFKGLKPAGQVLLAAIAGPTDTVEVMLNGQDPALRPSCHNSIGDAGPAIRLEALIKTFGDRGHFNTGVDSTGEIIPLSICSDDYSPGLAHIGNLTTSQILSSWCLPYSPADTNPLTFAIEPDCLVVSSKAGRIPACNTTSKSPCYKITASPSCSKKTALQIENIKPADLGSEVLATCLVL